MIQTSPLSETPNIISIANLLWGLVLYGHSAVSAAESVAMNNLSNSCTGYTSAGAAFSLNIYKLQSCINTSHPPLA